MAEKLPRSSASLPDVAAVNALLPQTQCKKCHYEGCLPYAEAMVNKGAPINQCPPGGQQGIKKLAQLLHVKEVPLNPLHGEEKSTPEVAVIIEEDCIGCTLCIKACPVDAIVGAAKHMHTVISDECTGCELCIHPCPVDCIVMKADATHRHDSDYARKRYEQRQQRQARETSKQRAHREQRRQRIENNKNNTVANPQTSTTTPKSELIAKALDRAQAKKANYAGLANAKQPELLSDDALD